MVDMLGIEIPAQPRPPETVGGDMKFRIEHFRFFRMSMRRFN
jgi:hypothetical protein